MQMSRLLEYTYGVTCAIAVLWGEISALLKNVSADGVGSLAAPYLDHLDRQHEAVALHVLHALDGVEIAAGLWRRAAAGVVARGAAGVAIALESRGQAGGQRRSGHLGRGYQLLKAEPIPVRQQPVQLLLDDSARSHGRGSIGGGERSS
jgi:hypothetical protein